MFPQQHIVNVEKLKLYAPYSRIHSSTAFVQMPGRNQKKFSTSLNQQPLADFKVGVDNVIFSVDTEKNRLLVLLVMRQQEPFLNYWSLPGTLVREGESLEDAAYRIMAEKIRVKNLYLEQLYTFGGPIVTQGKQLAVMVYVTYPLVILLSSDLRKQN